MTTARRTQFAHVAALALAGCAAHATSVAPASTASNEAVERSHTAAFAGVERSAIGWLAAADPRLAMRASTEAPAPVLERIGMDAVLAEDATAHIHAGSLDLFAFKGRAHALERAAALVEAFQDSLPEAAPPGSAVGRPRLERELLSRLIEEERARAQDEAALGDASADLVRGIISTWTAPDEQVESPDRDEWIARHLLEVGQSLHGAGPRSGPTDLDAALYPLERMLTPARFPKGAAAIAHVRVALDEDMRAMPVIPSAERVRRSAKVHLGVDVDPATLPPRLDLLAVRLGELATDALAKSNDSKERVEGRARELLFSEPRCLAPETGTLVRAMAPPPERAAVCGVVRALSEENRAAALTMLHDDVVLAAAAIEAAPPPRTALLSKPPNETVDSLRRLARERPAVALGIALAAELIFAPDSGSATGSSASAEAGAGDDANADARVRAWVALGEAPLDVVAREIAK